MASQDNHLITILKDPLFLTMVRKFNKVQEKTKKLDSVFLNQALLFFPGCCIIVALFYFSAL